MSNDVLIVRPASVPAIPAFSIAPGQTLVVGRTAGADVVLDHLTVGRRHARFVYAEAGCFVEDVGSPAGTYLNGQIVSAPARIAPGDRLRLGGLELVVERPA